MKGCTKPRDKIHQGRGGGNSANQTRSREMDLLPNPKLMDLWCQTRSPNATRHNQLAHFCSHKTAQTDPKEHNIIFEVSLSATLTRNRYPVVPRLFLFRLLEFDVLALR